MVKIAQASINEKGKITGGKFGNQNGKELNIIKLQKNNFKYTLRCCNPLVASVIAAVAELGVKNKHIGYGQAYRNSIWKQIKKMDVPHVAYIKEDCECDCSSFVSTCVLLAWYFIFGEWLQLGQEANLPCTSNMINRFKSTGKFVCLQKTKLEDLKKGDILLNPGKHTVVVVSVNE